MKNIGVLLLVLVVAQAYAQVPNFSLTNVIDGKTVTLDAYSARDGVVIIFTSNACPYDEYYRGRINKLSKEFGDKVPVVLVNSSADATESVEAMKKAGKQLGLAVPYLADKDQTLMLALKATKSPQAFLLKNAGGKFTVFYNGAIDDNAQVEADVRANYLRDAINALLGNQGVAAPEVRPVGCSIKRK
jgi:peroxiredoxin